MKHRAATECLPISNERMANVKALLPFKLYVTANIENIMFFMAIDGVVLDDATARFPFTVESISLNSGFDISP